MKPGNIVLGRKRRQRIRRIAAEEYAAASGDLAISYRATESRLNAEFGSIWISLALALAWQLLMWWIENRTDPQIVGYEYRPGEPGYSAIMEEMF